MPAGISGRNSRVIPYNSCNAITAVTSRHDGHHPAAAYTAYTAMTSSGTAITTREISAFTDARICAGGRRRRERLAQILLAEVRPQRRVKWNSA